MIGINMMKLGKKPAVFDPKTKKLTAPLKSIVNTTPSNINWINGVSWPMWNNDRIGCCTQVSVASAIRTWNFNEGSNVLLTDDMVIKNYSDESGYNPTNPNSDQGAVETDVLKRWVNIGYQTPNGVNKLIDFGFINPRNHKSVQRAIYLMGGLYIGISVPQFAMESQNQTWDLEYNDTEIVGGHAIYLHGYDNDYLYLNTWGSEWKMSWDFFNQYCDEAYGLVSEDWLNKNKNSPIGENLSTLIQELNNL